MNIKDYLELVLFVVVLALLTKPLGLYMEKIFSGQKTFLHPVFGWLENFIYRITGINYKEDQDWKKYSVNLLVFSFVGIAFTYIILRTQDKLPFNPQNFAALSPHLAWNTAMSFSTNTNWQSYGGETTMSYFSQMVALVLHNFLSAAIGISAAVALIRGIAKKESKGLGNFWVDMVRSNLYILLPISFVYAIFLISQGMIQNFSAYAQATTLEGAKQVIAQGPVASQVAIKLLGTNGGGFFNVNAAHPFENPTPFSNFIQMLSIFLIPSALVYLFGRMVKHMKHAWSVWGVMVCLFVVGVFIAGHYEYAGNPHFTALGTSSPMNMEGKEVRFGIFDSSLFATVTTDTSCGAVNSMHDSFTPLGGIVPLVNMLLGEVVFGGVGSGLYGMILFIMLTVFIAGLMVGRTPEYLGKKIEGREIKFIMLALVSLALPTLVLTAWAVLDARGLAGLNNTGPHGFSEIFYAYASSVANNGSAFAGLSANTYFYNYTLSIAMFLGRFISAFAMLAVAGSMVTKKTHPDGEGTFPVHGFLFSALLVGVIIIVGALTFFPALSLGPIVEHFDMLNGKLY